MTREEAMRRAEQLLIDAERNVHSLNAAETMTRVAVGYLFLADRLAP